jgi:[acyl-carrier-protein] S-malonyltransferase
VWAANYNAPGQVVIAGDADAITEASRIAKELGAKKVLPMAVGGAFHTPLMAPARDRLKKALAATDLRDPDVAIVANVDGAQHRSAAEWPALLTAQLCSPVRWRQCLHELASGGMTTFVELGPGTVLTGMAKRTIEGARAVSVSTPGDLDTLLEVLAGQPAPGAVHNGWWSVQPPGSSRRSTPPVPAGASRLAPCSATSPITRCAHRSRAP